MKVKEKRRREAASSSSSDDEDSDLEKNFALFAGEEDHGGEEESGDEEEEGSGSYEDESEEEGGGASDDGDESKEEGGGASDDGEESEEEGGGASDDEESEEEGGGASDDDEESEEEGGGGGGASDDEESEDAGGTSEIQTREDVKKELSTMSFEDVLKLQNKVGTKVYNEVAYGGGKGGGTREKKRQNKNRPTEMSAKRPAPFLRQVVSVRKPTFRDPRFDDLSGEYKPEIFEKTYNFINDIKHREKEMVQKQLKKTKNNADRKEKLHFLLKRMENQERARKSREQQRERELQFKRQQRERANQGARPFFLKNSEKKKLQLAEKFQELKKSGKLENFLSKKRKRNAVKDRRKLPNQPQRKKAA